MRIRTSVALPMVLSFAACTSNSTSRSPAQSDSAKHQAPTTSPANMSHGEAPVGSSAEPAPVSPDAPPRATNRLVRVRFVIRDTLIQVSKSTTYRAWTFEGRVPGPTVRVTQGDSVDFTLVNSAAMPHSMDFHAAQIAPNKYYVNVNPKDSIHYAFVAEVPGVFMYH